MIEGGPHHKEITCLFGHFPNPGAILKIGASLRDVIYEQPPILPFAIDFAPNSVKAGTKLQLEVLHRMIGRALCYHLFASDVMNFIQKIALIDMLG